MCSKPYVESVHREDQYRAKVESKRSSHLFRMTSFDLPDHLSGPHLLPFAPAFKVAEEGATGTDLSASMYQTGKLSITIAQAEAFVVYVPNTCYIYHPRRTT
jgi:hypothetical protein